MSALGALRARWRVPVAVFALELVIAWSLAAAMSVLVGAPLHEHPDGSAALFMPGGARLALDLVLTRGESLRAAAALAGVALTAYATLSLWLSSAVTRALGAPEAEPSTHSATHAARSIPGAIALALLALAGYGVCGVGTYFAGAAALDAAASVADPRAHAALLALAVAPGLALAVGVLAWHDHARAHLVLAREGPIAAARRGLAHVLSNTRAAVLPLPVYVLAGTACVLVGGALDASLAARGTPVAVAAAAQLVPLFLRAAARALWLARVTAVYRASAA